MIDRGQHEILRLSYARMEGQASAAQLSRLESLLIDDVKAREIYIEFMELAASLCWQRSANRHEVLLEENLSRQAWTQAIQAGDLAAPGVPGVALLGSPSLWRSINRRVLCSIAGCAALFVVYFAAISWGIFSKTLSNARLATNLKSEFSDPKLEISNQQSEVAPVATIRNTANVEWSDQVGKSLSDLQSTSRRDASTEVAAGETLEIDSGLVELRLGQGVTLIIEGSAKWSVDSDNSATLARGNLVAKVPPQAAGFTLETPLARIVDLGTEFSADVTSTGQTTLQVINGEVQFVHNSSKAKPQRLTAGEARRIGISASNGATYVEKIPFDAGHVAGSSPSQKSLKRWRDASEKLRADPGLVAYYDFEVSDNQLRNVLADGLHGEIITARKHVSWTDGRWYGKRALALGRDFASAAVADDPALVPDESWSVAVWFRVDALPVGEVPADHALIVGKGNYPYRSYSLWLRTNGQLLWSANHPDNEQTYFFSADPIEVHRWHLAVGVIETGTMRLYIDGVESAFVKANALAVASDNQPLAIGRSLEPDRAEPFTGAIDELAIFRRALTAEEVRLLYESGRIE